MKQKKQPNFFLVGAPKCATTAMTSFLSQHPDIFIPEIKEPHYFGSDLIFRRNFVRGNEWFRPPFTQYLNLYSPVTTEKMCGDASVLYLYSRTAPMELKSFCPDAKIIIIIRNPIEMIYSLHSHWLYNLNENVVDFEKALAIESERKMGKLIPPNSYWVEGLMYSQVGLFSRNIKRYLSEFGRENMHIAVHDDIKTDIGSEYRKMLKFLSVDTAFQPDFIRVNAHKEIRSRFLQNLFIDPPEILQRVATPLIQVPTIRRIMKTFATAVNVRKKKRKPMTIKANRILQNCYAEEIDNLSDLLNRDLTHWKETEYE